MADHALGSAGVVPGLLANAAREARILDFISAVRARLVYQLRIGLLGVPKIGVTHPLAYLPGQQPGLDPATHMRITLLRGQEKGLDQNGPFGKVPTPGLGEIDLRS